MLYCTNCKVHISTKTEVCPLCRQKLVGNSAGCEQTFPQFNKPLKDKTKFPKLALILGIFSFAICLLVNLLTYNGVLWSIIEMFGVAYLWILSIWSFKRDVQLGKKIIVNTIAISALVMSVNIFGYNIATLPNTFWSLTYVIPFVMIVGMFFLNLAVLHRKYSLKDFFFSQISIFCFATAVGVVALCGFASAIYPAIILLTITGILVIHSVSMTRRKTLAEALKRQFYF